MTKLPTRLPAAVLTFALIAALCAGPSFALSGGPEKEDPARPATASSRSQEQEKAAQSATNVEVTVTAPRVEIPLKKNPAATTVVETPDPQGHAPDDRHRRGPQARPGVQVDNQADGERVHLYIRGEGILTERGTRGVKTLVDGIPLNDPSGYVSDFYDIDWTAVRRIEVLRGPAAAFYGSGSSGGIINILTRDGGPTPISGERRPRPGRLRPQEGLRGDRRHDRHHELQPDRLHALRGRLPGLVRVQGR